MDNDARIDIRLPRTEKEQALFVARETGANLSEIIRAGIAVVASNPRMAETLIGRFREVKHIQDDKDDADA